MSFELCSKSDKLLEKLQNDINDIVYALNAEYKMKMQKINKDYYEELTKTIHYLYKKNDIQIEQNKLNKINKLNQIRKEMVKIKNDKSGYDNKNNGKDNDNDKDKDKDIDIDIDIDMWVDKMEE